MVKPCEQEGKGCSGIAIGATIVSIVIVGSAGLIYLKTPQFWLFWLIFAIVLLIEAFVIYTSIRMSPKNHIREATVEINRNSQRILRLEKLNSGKTTQHEINFAEITHILIYGNDIGHTFYVTLTIESKNQTLPINTIRVSTWPFNPIIELGKKLGQFTKRPVLLKVTELNKIVSEETIQE